MGFPELLETLLYPVVLEISVFGMKPANLRGVTQWRM